MIDEKEFDNLYNEEDDSQEVKQQKVKPQVNVDDSYMKFMENFDQNNDGQLSKNEVENFIESKPEEAAQILPEGSDIQQEALQVNDGDKRTDEVSNEVVEDFIKNVEEQENAKNPEAAQFVKEADEKLSQMDPIQSKLIGKKLDDQFRNWGSKLHNLDNFRSVKDTEPGIYSKSIDKAKKILNDPDAAVKQSKYLNTKDPEMREYIRAKYGKSFLNKLDRRNVLKGLRDDSLEKARYISNQLYEPSHSQDKRNKSKYEVNDDLRKSGDSSQINWNKSPDFNPRTGKVNKRQAEKIEKAKGYKQDLEQNVKLREQVEKNKDFDYTQWWTKDKDQLYKELGGKTLHEQSIDDLKSLVKDPNLSQYKTEIKAELAYRTGNGTVLATIPDATWSQERFEEYTDKLDKTIQALDPNNPDSIQQLQEIQKMKESLEAANLDRIDVVENQEEEINETSVDPNEAAMELINQESKERSEQQKRLEEFIHQTRKELKAKYNQEPDVDPEEKKKLNDPNKQLAIYDPKALMVTDKKIDKIEEQIKEKEEKIRKKWKLPKLDYHGKPIEGISSSFSQSPTKEIEGPKGTGPHLSSKAGAFPTGHGGAAVSTSGSGFRPHELRKDVGGTSGVNTISAKPMVEQVETPNASVKGNKYNVEGGSVGRTPGIVGWRTVNGGRINSSQGKAPHFSSKSSGGSSGSTLRKVSKTEQHITKKSVAQKILSASHNWPVDEQGYRDSQDRYLPIRLFVKQDSIEISILGTGRKRKNFEGITDQELQLVSRMI